MKSASLIAALLFSTSLTSHAQVSTIQIGGNGGWDYLNADAASRKLYVSHGPQVIVLDMDSHKVIKSIEGFESVHGIVIMSDGKKGFISDGKGNEVAIFDPVTLKVSRKIPTDKDPNSMVLNPASGKLFVGHKPNHSMTVMDAASGAITGKVQLDGVPEFPVSEGSSIFVNIDDKAKIARINAKTLAMETYWNLPGCERPSGLAVDSARHRLFSSCRNGVMVILDSRNGKVVSTQKIGLKTDAARFDPTTGNAFASCGDGTMTVIGRRKGDEYFVRATVTTAVGARTMAFDRKSHTAFLSTAKMTVQSGDSKPQRIPDTFQVLVVSPSIWN